MANLKIQLGNTSQTIDVKSYTYQDVQSNFLPNEVWTDVRVNQDVNAILGALQNIFDYTPGERILEPTFGLNLKGLLYEPMNDQTAQAIGLEIYNTITQWETRIRIKNVNVFPDYDDNTYYVTITFTCKQLNIGKEFKFSKALLHSL